MTDPGPTAAIAYGVASMLQSAGVGTFNPDAEVTDGTVELVFKMMPTSPDRALVIDVIPTQDDALNPMGQYAIRLRGRGAPNDPLDVDSILDAAFQVLHAASYLDFGGIVQVTQILRRPNGVAQQGFDAQSRWLRADQYVADVDYPPTAQRP